MDPPKCSNDKTTTSHYLLKDSDKLYEKISENDKKRKLQLADHFAQDLNNILKKYDYDYNISIIPGYKNLSILVDFLFSSQYDSVIKLDDYSNTLLNENIVKK